MLGRRIFLISRQKPSFFFLPLRSLTVLGVHFREEQVHQSKLLKKEKKSKLKARKRRPECLSEPQLACFLGDLHSQIFQVPSGFRHGHEQD